MSYCDQVEVAPSLVLTVDSPIWGVNPDLLPLLFNILLEFQVCMVKKKHTKEMDIKIEILNKWLRKT